MVFYVLEVLRSPLQARLRDEQTNSLKFKPRKFTHKTGKTNCNT